ncbi:MAG TPA: RNA 2',3'-cyclic phosphodiesterase [Geminicoccaceae bacterium]|jgi:2'-5' RNA ligase|nr:RNA 2',3'-cyclic phosphodiesterase [Geminicoccaceae bacterium]
MPRLFIALDLPEDVLDALDRLCEGLPGVRWSDPGQFHLTLRFLGEVEQGTFYEVGEALAGVSHPPFELALKGLGQFPPRGAPHTLWAGVDDPAGTLPTLRRRIERALGEVGLEPERRKFAPHVTLGRFKAPPPEERLASYLFRRNLFRTERFPVSSFGLYSSQLRPEGSRYTLEADYDFVTGVAERV